MLQPKQACLCATSAAVVVFNAGRGVMSVVCCGLLQTSEACVGTVWVLLLLVAMHWSRVQGASHLEHIRASRARRAACLMTVALGRSRPCASHEVMQRFKSPGHAADLIHLMQVRLLMLRHDVVSSGTPCLK
jgi:hypothetical protein